MTEKKTDAAKMGGTFSLPPAPPSTQPGEEGPEL